MNPSPTILLLDDEPLLRRATALMLSNHGARVIEAADADDAVALAEACLYDVAVFDVSGPGPGPADVLARMRAGGLVPRRVIAVVEAGAAPFVAAQFTQVIEKPYPFDSLVRAIFGDAGRRRTRSGVYPSVRPHALATARATSSRSGRAARAQRGRGA